MPEEEQESGGIENADFKSPRTGPESTSESEILEQARRELSALGLEVNEKNVEALVAQLNTPQIPNPSQYQSLVEALSSMDRQNPQITPDAIKANIEAQMIAHEIVEVTHAEGPSVWDHVRLTLENVNSLTEADGVTDRDREALKLIMLYHDLGKAEVWDKALDKKRDNSKKTADRLTKGSLHQSMIGHERASHDKMEEGFRKSKLIEGIADKTEQDLVVARFITVIGNHMHTSMVESWSPEFVNLEVNKSTVKEAKNIIQVVEGLGVDDVERERVAELLSLLFRVDGMSTLKVSLKEGKVEFSDNEKKSKVTKGQIWESYLQAKKLLNKEAQEQELRKLAEQQREMDVFGMSILEYVGSLDLSPEKRGRTIGTIKKLFAQNSELEPQVLRELVDSEVKYQ